MNDGDAAGETRLSPAGDYFPIGDHRGVARTASPARGGTTPRGRPGEPELLRVMTWLRPRDYVLAHLLDQHATLTTPQITAVLFTSESRARARLYRLRGLGWVGCFTSVRFRSRLPMHWILGPAGAIYAAHYQGRPPPTPRTLRHRAEAIAASAHLAHTDGANQFFIDLLAHARATPGARLARWWSPARAAAATGRRVHPDGHGVWEVDGRQVGFWLEHDTGSETIGRLIDKIEPYRRLRRDGGPDYPLLFHLPNAAREANMHGRLNGRVAELGVLLATSCHEHDPSGRVWKIVGNGPGRVRLADLPSRPGLAGPYHPGPPTPDEDPLRAM